MLDKLSVVFLIRLSIYTLLAFLSAKGLMYPYYRCINSVFDVCLIFVTTASLSTKTLGSLSSMVIIIVRKIRGMACICDWDYPDKNGYIKSLQADM